MRKDDREKIVRELMEEFSIQDIVSFNEFNIHDKLMENSDIYIKYYEHYLSEKQELTHLEDIKERLIGILYDELRFPQEDSKNPDTHKKLDKREILTYYIPRNPKIIQINELIERQRVRVEFFEIVTKAIDKMSWNMRNYLDSLKMRNI